MTHSPYILTASGRKVGPEFGAPSLDDITIALSRQPRFGGHGRIDNYSVLDHSLFVERLARSYTLFTQRYRPHLRLAALLHDAHEAMTADIPSPFKSDGMREVQRTLDERILAELMPETPKLFSRAHERISELDRRALYAEALVVGPPTLTTPELVLAHFGAAPLSNDVDVLRDMMEGIELRDRLAEFERLFAYLREQVLLTI